MHQLVYIYTDRLSDTAYQASVESFKAAFPSINPNSELLARDRFDREILAQIMAPYQEVEGNHRELVLLENIGINFVEHKLMDVIAQFEAYKNTWHRIADKQVSVYPPIILIDAGTPFIEDDLQEFARFSDSFVVLYDTTKQEATAHLLVNRQFWDWWVIGGRWPTEFKVEGQSRDLVAGFEPGTFTDLSKLDLSKHRTSALFKDIDWKERIEKYRGRFLALHDRIKDATAHLPPAWKVLHDTLGKAGAEKYYRFDTKAFDQWRKDVREAVAKTSNPNAAIEEPFFVNAEDLVGLSRREVIRFAIARAYCPSVMVVALEGQDTALYMLDFFCPSDPRNIRNIIRAARRLKPDTVVIAVDVHN